MKKQLKKYLCIMLTMAMVLGGSNMSAFADVKDTVSNDAVSVTGNRAQTTVSDTDTNGSENKNTADDAKSDTVDEDNKDSDTKSGSDSKSDEVSDNASNTTKTASDNETREVSDNGIKADIDVVAATDSSAVNVVVGDIIDYTVPSEASKTVSYDGGTKPAPAYTINSYKPDIDSSTYKLSYNYIQDDKWVSKNSVPEYKDAGEYTISVNLISSNGVIIPFDKNGKLYESYVFKITKKKVTVSSLSATASYNGKPLSCNEWKVIETSGGGFVTGEKNGVSANFTGKGTEIGTYENTFTLSFNGTDAKESNYDVTYVYGTLKVTGSEVNPTVSSNTLGSVNKLAASVTKSGTISISWKGVKTYYSKADKNTRDSKYKKTLYKVYRYNKKEGSWTDLTKTPITATKYTDSRAAGCDSLIYKVVPYGYDINAVSGNGAAAYIMAKPLMYQAQPNGDYDGIKVEFTNVGADSYTLVHYTNKKYPEEVNLISSALTLSANEQALTSYQYVDKGGSAVTITGSENYKTKYYFKVKANAYTFDDETLKVMVDATGYTSVVNAKLAGASTELVSVSSDYYNSVYVEWKKDSRVETDNKKDKYILYRSTSRAGKYSAVLTMQGNKINSALESGKLEYISANGSYKYHFTDLKPEVTYYYRIKVVDEGVSSGLSDYMSIRPVLDDIYKISVASKTTKSMQIQVGSISGADAYRVYYTKISDYDPDKNYTSDEIKALIGKVTPNYKKVKYSRNKTDWVDTLTVTGLTFGEYYGFYVEPMNSNHEHVTAESNRKYVAGMALIAAPTVTAKADSLTQISFTFTKVAGATGYYIQYSTDPSISQKNAADMEAYYVDKKTKKTIYNKRKVTIPNVTPGVPYYIRVTALRSGTKVSTTNSHGIFGDDSDAVSVYGCPKAVKNLKATYPAAGGVSVNATIGFTHTTTGKSGAADLYGYKIDRVLYKYNTKTKKYDISENGITVYRDYMAGKVTSTSPSFTNTSAEAIPAGYLAEYTVYPVYYSMATGVVNNGYIIGNPKTVKYMNPTRISFGSSKYTLEIGGSKQTSLKFGSPASKSDSNVTNEEVYYELVNEGAYGDSPSTYVTVNSTGKLTAKKKTLAFNTKKNAIYLYVRSKNDPNNVYARTKVIIEAKDEDDDDDDNKSSDLKVMIDAGHGGSDSGATSNGVYEKALNLEYANGVKDYLKDYGASVYMTRTSDTYLSLVERTTLAKNKGCNLFVSIHMNSGGGSGTEVYYSVNSKYAKKTLASNISSSVASALGIGNRGAKTRTGDNGDYYAVIRNSASNGIPGLIVEHGFIDNSTDRSALQNKKDAACKAEAKAIYKYWNK